MTTQSTQCWSRLSALFVTRNLQYWQDFTLEACFSPFRYLSTAWNTEYKKKAIQFQCCACMHVCVTLSVRTGVLRPLVIHWWNFASYLCYFVRPRVKRVTNRVPESNWNNLPITTFCSDIVLCLIFIIVYMSTEWRCACKHWQPCLATFRSIQHCKGDVQIRQPLV